MADQKTGSFETKIARLEAIVKELESGNAELDKTVALFQEGKALAAECDKILKSFQQQIDSAMRGSEQPEEPASGDEVPF